MQRTMTGAERALRRSLVQRLEPVSQRDRAGAGRGVEKISQAGVAAGSIAAGGILALAALIVLLQALVIALTELGLAPAWSSLIVGGAVAIIAFALIYKGINDLKGSNLAPRRTVESLRQDAHMVKEQAR